MTFKPVMALSISYNPKAECEDCSWRFQSRNVAVLARSHVKHTGHTVIVTKSTVSKYEPEDKA